MAGRPVYPKLNTTKAPPGGKRVSSAFSSPSYGGEQPLSSKDINTKKRPNGQRLRGESPPQKRVRSVDVDKYAVPGTPTGAGAAAATSQPYSRYNHLTGIDVPVPAGPYYKNLKDSQLIDQHRPARDTLQHPSDRRAGEIHAGSSTPLHTAPLASSMLPGHALSGHLDGCASGTVNSLRAIKARKRMQALAEAEKSTKAHNNHVLQAPRATNPGPDVSNHEPPFASSVANIKALQYDMAKLKNDWKVVQDRIGKLEEFQQNVPQEQSLLSIPERVDAVEKLVYDDIPQQFKQISAQDQRLDDNQSAVHSLEECKAAQSGEIQTMDRSIKSLQSTTSRLEQYYAAAVTQSQLGTVVLEPVKSTRQQELSVTETGFTREDPPRAALSAAPASLPDLSKLLDFQTKVEAGMFIDSSGIVDSFRRELGDVKKQSRRVAENEALINDIKVRIDDLEDKLEDKHKELKRAVKEGLDYGFAEDLQKYIGPWKTQFDVSNKTLLERIQDLEPLAGQIHSIREGQARLTKLIDGLDLALKARVGEVKSALGDWSARTDKMLSEIQADSTVTKAQLRDMKNSYVASQDLNSLKTTLVTRKEVDAITQTFATSEEVNAIKQYLATRKKIWDTRKAEVNSQLSGHAKMAKTDLEVLRIELGSKFDEQEKRLDELEEPLSVQKDEVATVSRNIHDLQLSLGSLETRVGPLPKEGLVKAFETRVGNLDATMKSTFIAHDDKINTVTERQKRLGTELSDLSKTVAEDKLSSRRTTLTGGSMDTADHSDLPQREQTILKDVQLAHDLISKTNERIDSIFEDIKRIDSNSEDIQEELRTQHENTGAMSRDLEEVQKDQQKLNNTVSAFAIDIPSNFVDTLEKSNDMIEGKIETFMDEMKTLQTEVRLQANTPSAQSAISAAERQQIHSIIKTEPEFQSWRGRTETTIQGVQTGLQKLERQVQTLPQSSTYSDGQFEILRSAISNLEVRYQNITTESIYQQMVHWITQNYPAAPDFLNLLKIMRQDLDANIRNLQGIMWVSQYSQSLWDITQKLPATLKNFENACEVAAKAITKAEAIEGAFNKHADYIAKLQAAHANTDSALVSVRERLQTSTKEHNNLSMLVESERKDRIKLESNLRGLITAEHDGWSQAYKSADTMIQVNRAESQDEMKKIVERVDHLYAVKPMLLRNIFQLRRVVEDVNKNLPEGGLKFTFEEFKMPDEVSTTIMTTKGKGRE